MRRTILALADWWYGFTPYSILPSLEESQFWPRERLQQWQLDCLKKLLVHAGAHVPFYRDLFKKIAFDPRDVRSLDDVRRLPIVGKQEIMAERLRFVSEVAPPPRVWLKTTGTTGNPFSFIRTRLAQSYKIASRLRFRRWYGIERHDAMLNVGGIPSHGSGLMESLSHRLHFLATHRVEVFSSDLEGPGKEAAARLIEKYRLKAVMGYPSGIASLARHLSAGRSLAFRPQVIFTNSETLTALMRRQIREGFGIEPRSDYVATEGSLAHECPQGGLHVDMEETLVELVPTEPSEPGTGEVIATFLHAFDFPLIRYRLGDVAAWDEADCPCGRGLATISGLVGRTSDGIAFPDGKIFTAANINMRIAHFPFIDRIRQYQIVQQSENTVELRILDVPETDGESVVAFQKALGDLFVGLRVEVKRVASFPREATGKFRPVVGLKKQGKSAGSSERPSEV
ncbi:MAG TPA: hypothetical protein VJL29_05400 [Thermoguttaceae bacterium]|nr:hypothetical protein [Thermoguttaceae bacterium]